MSDEMRCVGMRVIRVERHELLFPRTQGRVAGRLKGDMSLVASPLTPALSPEYEGEGVRGISAQAIVRSTPPADAGVKLTAGGGRLRLCF